MRTSDLFRCPYCGSNNMEITESHIYQQNNTGVRVDPEIPVSVCLCLDCEGTWQTDQQISQFAGQTVDQGVDMDWSDENLRFFWVRLTKPLFTYQDWFVIATDGRECYLMGPQPWRLWRTWEELQVDYEIGEEITQTKPNLDHKKARAELHRAMEELRKSCAEA